MAGLLCFPAQLVLWWKSYKDKQLLAKDPNDLSSLPAFLREVADCLLSALPCSASPKSSCSAGEGSKSRSPENRIAVSVGMGFCQELS